MGVENVPALNRLYYFLPLNEWSFLTVKKSHEDEKTNKFGRLMVKNTVWTTWKQSDASSSKKKKKKKTDASVSINMGVGVRIKHTLICHDVMHI
jgi:hypothetical protein